MATLDRATPFCLGWVDSASGQERDAFGGRFQARAAGGSRGIRFLEGRTPAHERTDGHFPVHVVTVNRGVEVPFEARWDGRWASGSSGSLRVNVWPARMPHSIRWLGPGDWWVIELDPGLLECVAAAAGLPRVPELRAVVGVSDPVACHLASTLALEIDERDPGGSLVRESVGLALASHVLHAHSARAEAHRPRGGGRASLGRGRINDVVRHIEERLDGDLSLGELAAVAGMELFSFVRAFQRSTGMAPHRFVLRARVERAKILLRDGALSVSDVALRTGFSTPSHFSATFRRFSGCTPRAWRAGAD